MNSVKALRPCEQNNTGQGEGRARAQQRKGEEGRNRSVASERKALSILAPLVLTVRMQ